MNFHVFVFIATVIFYIIMKMYKKSIEKNRKRNKNSSNLIYILFVPFLLYLTHFMFNFKNNTEQGMFRANSYSDELLTEPYPVSH